MAASTGDEDMRNGNRPSGARGGPAAGPSVSALLERLERVRRGGRGWTARCPAHEDSTPSLSIGQGRDGRVLLKCHAGCELEEITRALDLQVSDLFPRKMPAGRDTRRAVAATYDYVDYHGGLLFQVVRYAPKNFRQRRPDGQGGWISSRDGTEPVLYRLPRVLEAVKAGVEVFLVEGEKDVHRLEEAGAVATTWPGGAGAWDAEAARALAGARVTILPDNDAAGAEYAAAAARDLTNAGATVRLVALPGLGPKGDVSDWLDGGGSLEELSSLAGATPVWHAPRAYRSLREIQEDPDTHQELQAVTPRIAYRGRSTLLAAREKDGKSTFLRGLLAAVSRGSIFLDGRCAYGRGLLVAIEEHVGDVARSLTEFGADWDRVFVMTPADFYDRDPIEAIAEAVADLKPDIVGIDTLAALVSLLPSVPDAGDSAKWVPIMTRLTQIARGSGKTRSACGTPSKETALVILHHARKSDGKYRDSSAIGGGVDAILEMKEGKGGTRVVEGRGRWPIDKFTFLLRNRRFEVLDAELGVPERILLYVEGSPGCSQRKVEDNVHGRRQELRDAITELIDSGALEDQGSVHQGRRLYVRGARPAGAPDPSGTAPESRAA